MIKFIKKHTFILALASIAAQAHATEGKHFDGAYAGLGVGMVSQNIRHNNTVTLSSLPTGSPSVVGGDRSYAVAQSPKLSLSAGYSKVCKNKFYSAVELRAEAQSLNSIGTLNLDVLSATLPFTSQHKVRVRNNFNFNLLLKPGVLVAPQTVIYGIVGAELSRFNIRLSNIATPNSTAPDGALAGTASSNKNLYRVGLALGFGAEAYLVKAWSMGLEYMYSHYGKLSNVSYATTLQSSSTPTFEDLSGSATNGRLHNHTGLLQLRYHF